MSARWTNTITRQVIVAAVTRLVAANAGVGWVEAEIEAPNTPRLVQSKSNVSKTGGLCIVWLAV